jgi:iduronate 2-sulfatase
LENIRKIANGPYPAKESGSGLLRFRKLYGCDDGKDTEGIGRVRATHDTIVIFTSDHGYHLGEHDLWMKVSIHEESAKVPLVICVPGKKLAVCHSLSELIDLYPTYAA